MEDRLAKVRAELERRVRFHAESSDPLAPAYVSEDNVILSFIDSMQEEPVSEDLEEDVEKTKAMVKYFELSPDDIVDFCARHYIQLQKEQMMAEAIDVEVKVDAGGYPYIDKTIELYDYDKDIPLAKEGDKYKVILIKE